MSIMGSLGKYGKRFLNELGIEEDKDIPESFFEIIKTYSECFSEGEQFCLNDYHIAFVNQFKFSMDKVVGTNHNRYAGKTWLDAFMDLDRGEKLLDLYFKNPSYYDTLKERDGIDLGFALKNGEYYIFDKAGGGNNRMVLMKIKYLALKAKGDIDDKKLDVEFSFCGNVRMSPPDAIAKKIFYFMFPDGSYRESGYQILNKSNDITNPLFQIVTDYPVSTNVIRDDVTYDDILHLGEWLESDKFSKK